MVPSLRNVTDASVVVSGGAGDDKIRALSTGMLSVDAGSGDDTVDAHCASCGVVSAGDGNDLVYMARWGPPMEAQAMTSSRWQGRPSAPQAVHRRPSHERSRATLSQRAGVPERTERDTLTALSGTGGDDDRLDALSCYALWPLIMTCTLSPEGNTKLPVPSDDAAMPFIVTVSFPNVTTADPPTSFAVSTALFVVFWNTS